MPTEVMTEPQAQNRKLSEFRNEPLTDFTKPQNRAAMEKALEKVKGEFGREYPLVIGGQRITRLKKIDSPKPSPPAQPLRPFQKGNTRHPQQAPRPRTQPPATPHHPPPS